jgi:hypothetical protein
MELVFDAAAHPIGLVPEGFFALVPLAIWAFQRFVRKRAASIALPIIAALLFVGINGIQIWDLQRVQAMLRSGAGVQVTRGLITESWHIVTRSRDWSRASLAYKTTISEGFDVAGERFSWNIGDGFSPATFSNVGAKPLTFVKGAQVEVTWFTDPAAEHSRRIIRLRLGDPPPELTLPAGPEQARALFHRAFVAAFVAGDAERLNVLTHFPLRFAGNVLEANSAATLWAGLLTPTLQACVQSTRPRHDQDGGMSLSCAEVNFVFRSDEHGTLRLVEIGN